MNLLGITLDIKIETQDVYQRAMSITMNPEHINSLSDMVDKMPVGKVSSEGIAKTVPGMIGLADAPYMKSNISHGWKTQRLVGIITCVSSTPTNPDVWIRTYMVVYSDPTELSYNDTIDDNVIFHINKVLNVKEIYAGGAVVSSSIHSVFDVLVDNMGDAVYNEDTETLKLLRPADVITSLSNIEDAKFGNGTENIDLSSRYTNVATSSDVLNRVGTGHVAKVLNSLKSGMVEMDNSGYINDMYTNAVSAAMDPNMGQVPVIRELSKHRGVSLTSVFTLKDILALSNNRNTPPTPIVNRNLNPTSILGTESVSTLNVSLEISIGTGLITAIAAIMSKRFITTLSIEIKPDALNGGHIVILNNVDSIVEQIDHMPSIDNMMYQIEHIIIPNLTKGGTVNIQANIIIDLTFGGMLISINGGPTTPVMLPEWASSAYSPNIVNATTQNSTIHTYDNLRTMVLK